MPRQARLDAPGIYHHVINSRLALYFDSGDSGHLRTLLKNESTESVFSIYHELHDPSKIIGLSH